MQLGYDKAVEDCGRRLWSKTVAVFSEYDLLINSYKQKSVSFWRFSPLYINIIS